MNTETFLLREIVERHNSCIQQDSVSHVYNMAAAPLAKPPEPLNLDDTTHRGDNWKQFKCDWTYYERASKINKEDSCSEEEEVFFIHAVKSPASQPVLVTCTINKRHKVTFL